MPTLILLRHGESLWNRDNRFTGWTDVDLTERGLAEAKSAACMLAREGLQLHACYTSVLKRAVRTLWIVLDDMDLMWLPVQKCWRLNERHYGALQGLDKTETEDRFGAKQVFAWRKSYEIRPPALDTTDRRYPGHDPRYAGIEPSWLPRSESLKDAAERVLPYWRETIALKLKEDRNILIVAHANSLRALIKHLDAVPDEEIPKVKIPTGAPLLYELGQDLGVKERRYL